MSNERTRPPFEGSKGIPIQKMPDFNAAISDYAKILGEQCLVPPQDISRMEAEIRKGNKTREAGNRFINHVAGLKRGFNLP